MIRDLTEEDFATSNFRHLLWLAVEQPESELSRITREQLPQLRVRGHEKNGRLTGFVAVDLAAEPVTIEYIAVAEHLQRCGLGSALLEGVVEVADGKAIYAQTDNDAVGFYRSRGFTVDLGARDQRWPDRIRYDCRRDGSHPR